VKVREGHWAIQELARGLDIVEVLRDHIVGEHFDYIYIPCLARTQPLFSSRNLDFGATVASSFLFGK